MLFSSIEFLYYFLPIVVAVYFLVPRAWKNAVLLLASLVFLCLSVGHSSLMALLSLGLHMVSPSVCLSLCPNFSVL